MKNFRNMGPARDAGNMYSRENLGPHQLLHMTCLKGLQTQHGLVLIQQHMGCALLLLSSLRNHSLTYHSKSLYILMFNCNTSIIDLRAGTEKLEKTVPWIKGLRGKKGYPEATQSSSVTLFRIWLK